LACGGDGSALDDTVLRPGDRGRIEADIMRLEAVLREWRGVNENGKKWVSFKSVDLNGM
jgi:hypothetical protein